MAEITIPNGFTPRDLQADLMRYFDRGGLRAAACWPRRYGKDLTMVHQTVKQMLERPGMYFHMLPSHKQARKVLWDGFDNSGRKILDTAMPLALRSDTNKTEMKITLRNGAIWQLVGSDYYDSIVGSNPFGIVMSEAALSDPRAWSIFRPILAGNGGWAAFISTPRGYNWFHDMIKLAKGSESWFYSHAGVSVTKHISEAVLADERREMPDELYRQEYDVDFSAANVGAIFGRYIEQMEKEGKLAALPPHRAGMSEVWVTSDIGYRDKAAFIFFRRLRGGFEAFFYDEATGLDASDWIERLRRPGVPEIDVLVLPHDARARTFQSKHTVVEQFLASKLAGEVRVNTIRKKHDSINAGRMLCRSAVIDGEACADLVTALRAYSFRYDEETRSFSSEPNHDWSSHASDAWQEAGACLLEVVAPPPPKTIIVPSMDRSFTLEQLHSAVSPYNQSGGRL